MKTSSLPSTDCPEKTGFIKYYPKNIKLCNYYGSPHGGSRTPVIMGFKKAFVE